MPDYETERETLQWTPIYEKIVGILTGDDYQFSREQITPYAKIEGDIFCGDFEADNFVMDVETRLNVHIDQDFHTYLTEGGGTIEDLIIYIMNGCRDISAMSHRSPDTQESHSYIQTSPPITKKWWQIWKR